MINNMCSLEGQSQAASPAEKPHGYQPFIRIDLPFDFLFGHDLTSPSKTFQQT